MRKMVTQLESLQLQADVAKKESSEKELSVNIEKNRVASLLQDRFTVPVPKSFKHVLIQTERQEIESALGEQRQLQINSYARQFETRSIGLQEAQGTIDKQREMLQH